MDKFLENFHDLLEETEKEQITPETEFKNLDEWDSMTALMLIAMFDEQYGKKLMVIISKVHLHFQIYMH